MRSLNVGVGGKQILAGCVVKNYTRSRSNHVVKYGLWEIRRAHCRISNVNCDSPISNLGFGLDPRFVIAQEDKAAALSSGMLDDDFHQALNEHVQHDLA